MWSFEVAFRSLQSASIQSSRILMHDTHRHVSSAALAIIQWRGCNYTVERLPSSGDVAISYSGEVAIQWRGCHTAERLQSPQLHRGQRMLCVAMREWSPVAYSICLPLSAWAVNQLQYITNNYLNFIRCYRFKIATYNGLNPKASPRYERSTAKFYCRKLMNRSHLHWQQRTRKRSLLATRVALAYFSASQSSCATEH